LQDEVRKCKGIGHAEVDRGANISEYQDEEKGAKNIEGEEGREDGECSGVAAPNNHHEQ
jgi:hypothetical protein